MSSNSPIKKPARAKAPTGSSKTPPKSPTKTSKFSTKNSIKPAKQYDYMVYVEGFADGQTNIVWVSKGWNQEAAFLRTDTAFIEQDDVIKDELGINCVIARKGVDGKTFKPQSATSTYEWKQFVCIVEEGSNNAEKRFSIASAIIAHLNSNKDTYTYPHVTKFGSDRTRDPPRAVSSCLLDDAVISLMKANYPDYIDNISGLGQFPDIMAMYWDSTELGIAALEEDAASNQAEEIED
jgi:hypothetical protein